MGNRKTRRKPKGGFHWIVALSAVATGAAIWGTGDFIYNKFRRTLRN